MLLFFLSCFYFFFICYSYLKRERYLFPFSLRLFQVPFFILQSSTQDLFPPLNVVVVVVVVAPGARSRTTSRARKRGNGPRQSYGSPSNDHDLGTATV